MADTHDEQPQPIWEKLGISQETFLGFPPSTRSALARQHNPQPPVQRRPYRPEAPPEVLKQWAHLSPAARTAAYREWCESQPRP